MNNSDLDLFRRVILATQHSLRGLRQAWSAETAFRYEVYVLVVALPAAWYLGGNMVERALMIGCLLQVIVVEMVNSAIEAVVDRIGLERHELSGRAKDLGSAAVFCSILLASVVWLILLLD